MRKVWFIVLSLLLLLYIPVSITAAKLPEFTASTTFSWINSPPLKLKDLKGQVVVVEVWSST